MTLGSLHLFLTPRQLHFLFKFHEVFLADDPPAAADQSPLSAIHRNDAIRRYNLDGSRASSVSGDTLHSAARRSSSQRGLGSMSGGLGANYGWSSDQYCKNIILMYIRVCIVMFSCLWPQLNPLRSTINNTPTTRPAVNRTS